MGPKKSDMTRRQKMPKNTKINRYKRTFQFEEEGTYGEIGEKLEKLDLESVTNGKRGKKRVTISNGYENTVINGNREECGENSNNESENSDNESEKEMKEEAKLMMWVRK